MEFFEIVPRQPERERPKTPRSASYFRVHRATTPRPPSRSRAERAEQDSDAWQSKTERWRESGQVRWPPTTCGPDREAPEVVPVRRYNENMQQTWQGELWTRSLRKPGVLMQHPTFAVCNIGAKELHDEWGHVVPNSTRQWPFSGSTVPSSSTLPAKVDMKRWIERPVSTGKYAVDHMRGTRYQWDTAPRPCLIGI